MKKLVFIISVLIAAFCISGCSKDEEVLSLYKTWILVSYGNESNEVLKEAEGYYYQITFRPDGTYSGRAYGNEMGGDYKCKGKEIQISHPCMTKFDYEGSDPDSFFHEHFADVYTYTVTDMELKLFYSKDQYFKFRIKNDQ